MIWKSIIPRHARRILNWRGFIIIREKSGTLLSKILFPPSLACEP